MTGRRSLSSIAMSCGRKPSITLCEQRSEERRVGKEWWTGDWSSDVCSSDLGIKKGDALASVGACVVALLGVTCWRGTNEHGGKTALPDWADVALNDRETFLVFDSDVMRKKAVYYALRAEIGRASCRERVVDG